MCRCPYVSHFQLSQALLSAFHVLQSLTFPVDSIIHTCDVLTPSQQIGLNDVDNVCVIRS